MLIGDGDDHWARQVFSGHFTCDTQYADPEYVAYSRIF